MMTSKPVIFVAGATEPSHVHALRAGSTERTQCLIGNTILLSSNTLNGRLSNPCIYPQLEKAEEILALHKHPDHFNTIRFIPNHAPESNIPDLEKLLKLFNKHLDAIQLTEPTGGLIRYIARNHPHLGLIVELRNYTLQKNRPIKLAAELHKDYGDHLDMVIFGDCMSEGSLPEPRLLEEFLDALCTLQDRRSNTRQRKYSVGIAVDARRLENYSGLLMKYPEISIATGRSAFRDCRFNAEFAQDFVRGGIELYESVHSLNRSFGIAPSTIAPTAQA